MPVTLHLKNGEAVFSEPLLREMFDALIATKQDGKERGFDLCVEPGSLAPPRDPAGLLPSIGPEAVLTPGNQCTGEVCSVRISNCAYAESNKTAWGSYHTHPAVGNSRASPGDLLSSAHRMYLDPAFQVDCRAASSDGLLRCDAFEKPVTRERLSAYTRMYNKAITPFYDLWAQLGTMPKADEPFTFAYQFLDAELHRSVESHAFLLDMAVNRPSDQHAMPVGDDPCSLVTESAYWTSQFFHSVAAELQRHPDIWDEVSFGVWSLEALLSAAINDAKRIPCSSGQIRSMQVVRQRLQDLSLRYGVKEEP